MHAELNLETLAHRTLVLVDHEDEILHYRLINLLLKRGCIVTERASSTPIRVEGHIACPDLIIVGDLEDWPNTRMRPLRKMYPDAKIVLYGSEGHPGDVDLELVRSRGFDGYIPDEVDESKLVSLLQQLLAGKTTLPQATRSLRRGWGAIPAKTATDPFHAN